MFGLVSLAACSNDDDDRDMNSNGNVYVSMSQADISFKENKGVVTIPVTITGERNGDITVTCTVEEYPSAAGLEPAMEDVHYYLTSETITVWPEDDTAAFEVRLKDDRVMNDPRLFVIKLVSATGAQLGTLTETIVTIRDNDQEPYDRIGGTWTAYDVNGASVGELTFDGAEDETEDGYNSYYYLIMGNNYYDSDPEIIVKFNYTKGQATGTLTIDLDNQQLGACVSGSSSTTNTLIGYVDSQNYIQTGGVITMAWTEDYSEIYVTSSPQADNYASIDTFANFGSGWGYWTYCNNFSTLRQNID